MAPPARSDRAEMSFGRRPRLGPRACADALSICVMLEEVTGCWTAAPPKRRGM